MNARPPHPLDRSAGGLAVASLSRARKQKRSFDAVLTIEDPGCQPAMRLRFNRSPAPAHLVLDFEDLDDDTQGIQVATQSQVAQALEFARSAIGGSLLVHCYRGLSRSAAIALAILTDRSGPGSERTSLEQLLAIRPEAIPNLVVVKLADELLGRGGALIAAVAEWENQTPRLEQERGARRRFFSENQHLYKRRDA